MQWRSPITLAVLLAVLLGAAYYGWHAVVAPVTESSSDETPPSSQHKKREPTPTQVCTKRKTYPKGAEIRAESFRVNVYNAGGVSGQAGDVLAALMSRGFREGVAANPPAGVTATNVTILTPSPVPPQAKLVQEQFKGTVKLLPGPNLAAGVDVVVGPGYQGLTQDAPTSLTLHQSTTGCVESATKTPGSR